MTTKTGIIAIACLMLASSAAWCDVIALDPTGGNLQPEANPFTLGWQFTVSQSLTVTALAYYDAGGDGLANNHDVGIYVDSTGSELMSATVDSGTTDSLVNGFRVAQSINCNVTCILAPGTYDVLGFNPGPSDTFLAQASGTTVTGLTFDQAVGASTGSLQFTNASQSGEDIGIFGPNFFVNQPTPEPASFFLSGIACAALGLAGWIRRRAA